MRDSITGLSEKNDIRRSQIIKNLKYNIFLQINPAHLRKESMTYEGSVIVEFDMEKEEELFFKISS